MRNGKSIAEILKLKHEIRLKPKARFSMNIACKKQVKSVTTLWEGIMKVRH